MCIRDRSTGTAEISKEAMDLLSKYSWPGNVRELENVIHSASVICKGKRILSKDLPSTIDSEIDNSTTTSNPISIGGNNDVSHKDAHRDNTEEKSSNTTEKVNQEPLINFGETASNDDKEGLSSTAPSSISSEESFDIAYAHARKSTDRNLLETVEKEIIQRALKECGGNQVKASALLGITRATLRKRIDVFEIRY